MNVLERDWETRMANEFEALVERMLSIREDLMAMHRYESVDAMDMAGDCITDAWDAIRHIGDERRD